MSENSEGSVVSARTAANVASKVSDGPRLSSLTAAVRLLKEFSEQDAELGISALARRLGVAKSTVHRLASTLVAEGLLEQNPLTERYRLGLGLFKLGALVRQRLSVSTEAKGLLTDLRAELRENVSLAVLNGETITFLYDFESPQPVRVSSRIGLSEPAISCAEGIAILAHEPEPLVKSVLSSYQEDLSKSELRKFYEEMDKCRENGFVVKRDYLQSGATCIAAPVHDASGAVVGAVGVTAPTQRMTAAKLKSFAPRISAISDSISRRLGATVPATVVE